MINCYGYAAEGPRSSLRLFEFLRRDIEDNDIRIDIEYCGVCHTDIHKSRNDWGNSLFPMVPGHEIVGRVVAVGRNVSRFRVGDPAGVGCIVDSCRHCSSCLAALPQYCESGPISTYNSRDRRDGTVTLGGYSTTIVVDERYAVRIPSGMNRAAVAPLLCAGVTTYSALRRWNVGHGHRIGIVGLGGLGHLAIKFAKLLGAEVVAFTRSPGKLPIARQLGADEVVCLDDEAGMVAARNTLDLVFDTAPCTHDLNPLVRALKRDGTVIVLGSLAPESPMVHSALLVSGRKSIAGSMIGGIDETEEMLAFCAANGMTADVRLIDISRINDVFDRLTRGDTFYRFVVDMSSLKPAP